MILEAWKQGIWETVLKTFDLAPPLRIMHEILRLIRPFFLAGGVLMCALGAVSAWLVGAPVNTRLLLHAQWMITSIQLVAQTINEHFDQDVDSVNSHHRTWLSGGSGILQKGRLPTGIAFRLALLAALSALLSILLLLPRYPFAAAVGVIGILISWFYSAPPGSLVRRGWGEAIAAVNVAILAPACAALLQNNDQFHLTWLFWLPLFFLQVAMLTTFDLPDRSADQQFGKQTLALRLGPKWTPWTISAMIILPFGLWAVFWPQFNWVHAALPLAALQIVAVFRYIRNQHYRESWLTTGALLLFVLPSFLLVIQLVTLQI